MKYWLMKSEPDEVGIDHLVADPATPVPWFGVRNYQARNFMRDQMQQGDLVLFYHSSCAEPGVAGVVRVASTAYPDATQFDAGSHYFDPKSTPAEPRWLNVDVLLVAKTRFLPLQAMREDPVLEGMQVLKRGNRLSITPVDPAHWAHIANLIGFKG
ncbi:EVE domain-containing protein [Leeia oryzae]|uniref:EVE domain-containing protein n=1 Tax=Leeia oryzae TaxID=356662 RepID=UPI0004779C22|nr:EVE domain-containing protein [Leeia oryzae]